jgi:DNA-binding transcriptional LysR family regulator
MGNFVNIYPKVNIKLQIANTEEIIQKLLKFNIDIGLVEGSCTVDKIEIIPWRKDELVIIASKNHPLSTKNKILLEDLLAEKWILRESGSGTRENFERAIGTKIHPFLELGQSEAVKHAVIAGLGISCLSKITVENDLKSNQLVILKTPFLKLTRDFYILLHKIGY